MKGEPRSEKREVQGGPVRALGVLLFALAMLAGSPMRLTAQDTRADSAATLLRAAQVLQARGDLQLARELLRALANRFPGTPGADEGRLVLIQLGADESLTGFSRTGFLLWHTAFGAWLGVAIPAAFDAQGSEPYGAGLLIGAPLGFFSSRALAHSRHLTAGQAAILQFGSLWGTWQGFGWQAAADLGVERICEFDFCYDSSSDTAPWVAAVVGGVAGFGAGLLASRVELREGQAAVITNLAQWATWYGLAAGWIADGDEDATLTTALIAGNIGLLAGIPFGRSWNPSASRVRTISAAGLAGGLAGLGVALLTSTDDDQVVAALGAAGSTIGLLAGTALTRHHDQPGGSKDDSGPSTALLSYRGTWRIGAPAPVLAAVAAPDGARRLTVPGVRIPLLHLEW
jgi:hypothetical protein